MKRILLLCAFLCVFLTVKAQFPGMGGPAKPTIAGRITIIVIDSATQKPIDYASVSLTKAKDNKPVNGGVTDEKGKVVLQNITPDEYKLSIGFMGYKSKSIAVKTTPEKPDQNLGTISLSGIANTLNEVTVEGKKSMIENKIDRMVYNAEADATNAGGDATDVMRKVPMLSVDMEGNLQLRGAPVRVLINGKPSGTMASSIADALKMMPAEQVKSVEVITSPSAKYDAEGSGGIVNIITKKSNAEGVSGSVNTAVGTRQNNGAFNLTAKTGRLSMNTALGGNYAYAQNSKVIMLNETKLNDGTTNTISRDGYSKWDRNGFNGSLGLDYDFNAYNNISTTAKFNRFSNGGPGQSDYIINGVMSKNISSMNMTMNNLDWNMDYKKTTKKAGEEFSISAQLSTGRTPQTFSNSLSSPLYPVTLETFSANVGKNNEYTAQTDYIYPFSKKTTLEIGAKGIFRDFNSRFDASAKDFKYNQNVASLYSVISFNLTKKLQVKGGVRGEYTKIDFNTKANGIEKNDYLNLFPSVIIAQTLKGSSLLKLSYNRRIQRPSQTYLNPFRNESDQFNIMQGNPQLNPELSDNLELGYSTYIKGSIINASLFYRKTNGIIESSISPLIENGVNKTFSTYINVGSLNTFGFNLFGSYNPKPKWTLMSSIGMNSYDIKSDIIAAKRTYFMFNLFARSAYAFGKGWNTEFYGIATSPRRTYQGKTDAFYFYGAAFKKEVLKKKGSIGVNVLNPFTRDLKINTNNNSVNNTGTIYTSTQIYYPLRSFGLNFSYTFGKLKFTEKKKIKNDDVKQEEQQGGGQMGGMGGNQK